MGSRSPQDRIKNQFAPSPPYPEPLQTDDAINAWFHARDLNCTAGDVTRAFSASLARLGERASSLPETDLADPNRFSSLEGDALGALIAGRGFFGHLHEEHDLDIEAWLMKVHRA